MGKNKRKRERRGREPFKGALGNIKGSLQKMTFGMGCNFCSKKTLEHIPIRIPKPTGWAFVEEQHGEVSIKWDTFYCCLDQKCIESGLKILRDALTEGIVIAGNPPADVIMTQEE